jgi:hypothetical protein
MPLYRLRRHVIYDSGCGQTQEVWGADRPFGSPALKTRPSPRDTDADDPLRRGGRNECICAPLLVLDGDYVTWDDIWEWLSVAEAAGYEVVSGFKKMSPYSTIVLRGP